MMLPVFFCRSRIRAFGSRLFLLALAAAAILFVGDIRLTSQSPTFRIIQLTDDAIVGGSININPHTLGISRDGSMVVFLNGGVTYTGSGQLYSVPSDGTSAPIRITPPDLNVTTNWDFGGTKVVFVAQSPPYSSDNPSGCSNLGCPGEVYVVNPDGTGLTQLTTGGDGYGGLFGGYTPVRISADGRIINFVRGGVLYFMNSDGTNQHPLVLPQSAPQVGSLSSDGSRMAYGCQTTSSTLYQSLCVIDTDGTGFREIAIGTNNRGLMLSGDGTTIGYSGETQGVANIVKTDGTGQRILDASPSPFAFGPSISHDGSMLCYVVPLPFQTNMDLFCINADGTNRRNISNTPTNAGEFLYKSSLSENGAVVVFLAAADLDPGKNTDGTWEVFAAVLSPSLAIDGAPVSSRAQQEAFGFTGFGFTPNQLVSPRVLQPDNTEITLTPSILADASGRVAWTIQTSCVDPAGTYRVRAIDEATGQVSNSVLEIIQAAVDCTSVPAPLISLVTPGSGPDAGGTPITITGTGFANGASVTLGGALAANVNVVNQTIITAVTPAHAAGVVDVVVMNPDGQSGVLAVAFTYFPTACVTTSIDPVGSGSVTLNPAGPCFIAGTSVTVTATPASGYRFLNWSGALSGSTNPASFTVQLSTSVGARFERVPALEGRVGIWDGEFWPLDGTGVQMISVSAQPAGGTAVPASSFGSGQFRFDSLPDGTYQLSIVFAYRESIPPNLQTCFGVSVGTSERSLVKTTVVRVQYQHSGNTRISVRVSPPVILLHGIRSDFTKWFDAEAITSSQKWDDVLRRSGFITLTPNYMSLTNGDWTNSIDTLRLHVWEHLMRLTTTATSANLPHWTMVAHSQGGLVTRAMLWTPPTSGSDPVSASLDSIFLLGTPNSGAVNGVAALLCVGYLSTDNVMRDFNHRFSDFRNKPVLAFAGTPPLLTIAAKVAGWPWGVGRVRWDGLVVEDSVYHIYTEQGLQTTLPRIEGVSFPYYHSSPFPPPRLGDSGSLPILTSYIMPRLAPPNVVVESR
jgi:Tol biopolymer transport system component/pimeloyl-ACP methyl ester carboxylesterase